jgi:hypothetical protein
MGVGAALTAALVAGGPARNRACARPTARTQRGKHVNAIFTKLALTTELTTHRRVTAVLTFLRDAGLRSRNRRKPPAANRNRTCGEPHPARRPATFRAARRKPSVDGTARTY